VINRESTFSYFRIMLSVESVEPSFMTINSSDGSSIFKIAGRSVSRYKDPFLTGKRAEIELL
jgi:hypothetical protein